MLVLYNNISQRALSKGFIQGVKKQKIKPACNRIKDYCIFTFLNHAKRKLIIVY